MLYKLIVRKVCFREILSSKRLLTVLNTNVVQNNEKCLLIHLQWLSWEVIHNSHKSFKESRDRSHVATDYSKGCIMGRVTRRLGDRYLAPTVITNTAKRKDISSLFPVLGPGCSRPWWTLLWSWVCRWMTGRAAHSVSGWRWQSHSGTLSGGRNLQAERRTPFQYTSGIHQILIIARVTL